MPERQRLAIAAAALTACGGLLVTVASRPLPRLVWNASASAPIGLYRTAPGAPLRVRDMVIARLPASVEHLAAQRHYLPAGIPLVKRVVAIGGAHVCAVGSDITVDGRLLVTRLARDRAGRPLPAWQGCRTLAQGEVFLAMVGVRESFDGRYFGVTARTDVIAKAEPLWLR